MRRAAFAALLGILLVLGVVVAGVTAAPGKDCARGPETKPGNAVAGGHWIRCSDLPTISFTIPTVTLPTVPDETTVPTPTVPDTTIDTPTTPTVEVPELPGASGTIRIHFNKPKRVREVEIVVPNQPPRAEARDSGGVTVSPKPKAFGIPDEVVGVALLVGLGAAIGIGIAGRGKAETLRPR